MVGAEEEERAVEVHLVERDHQVVDAAVREVIQRLLLIKPRTVRDWSSAGPANENELASNMENQSTAEKN